MYYNVFFIINNISKISISKVIFFITLDLHKTNHNKLKLDLVRLSKINAGNRQHPLDILKNKTPLSEKCFLRIDLVVREKASEWSCIWLFFK